MHHFAAKRFQNLGTRTRSLTALGMLGWPSIHAYIHYRQLNFLGRLCRLVQSSSIKKVFLFRLSTWRDTDSQTGYIPMVNSLLEKYSLTLYIKEYLSTGNFPSKGDWKRTTLKVILQTETTQKEQSLSGHLEQCRLKDWLTGSHPMPHCKQQQFRIGPVHLAWKIWDTKYNARVQLAQLVKLFCVPNYSQAKVCPYCNMQYCDVITHYICSCIKYAEVREDFWKYITENLPIKLGAYLHNIPDWAFTVVILSGVIPQCDGCPVDISDIQFDESIHRLVKASARTWFAIRSEL